MQINAINEYVHISLFHFPILFIEALLSCIETYNEGVQTPLTISVIESFKKTQVSLSIPSLKG